MAADSGGYAEALCVARQRTPGRCAFAAEGSGSFGAGLTRFLSCRGEQVFEVGRLRRERGSGGKSDALDAVRAARSVLGRKRPATPRSAGEREGLRALMAAREGAVNVKLTGLCQRRDLLITTPEPLAQRVAAAHPSRLLRLAATRPERCQDPELLLRPDGPLPPRPQRRPPTQPGPAHDPPHHTTITPRDDRLHRPSPPRRQDPSRSNPLPQALPRPQPLPTPRERSAATHVTNIEASLGHPRSPAVGHLEQVAWA